MISGAAAKDVRVSCHQIPAAEADGLKVVYGTRYSPRPQRLRPGLGQARWRRAERGTDAGARLVGGPSASHFEGKLSWDDANGDRPTPRLASSVAVSVSNVLVCTTIRARATRPAAGDGRCRGLNAAARSSLFAREVAVAAQGRHLRRPQPRASGVRAASRGYSRSVRAGPNCRRHARCFRRRLRLLLCFRGEAHQGANQEANP